MDGFHGFVPGKKAPIPTKRHRRRPPEGPDFSVITLWLMAALTFAVAFGYAVG